MRKKVYLCTGLGRVWKDGSMRGAEWLLCNTYNLYWLCFWHVPLCFFLSLLRIGEYKYYLDNIDGEHNLFISLNNFNNFWQNASQFKLCVSSQVCSINEWELFEFKKLYKYFTLGTSGRHFSQSSLPYPKTKLFWLYSLKWLLADKFAKFHKI